MIYEDFVIKLIYLKLLLNKYNEWDNYIMVRERVN